MRLSLAIAVFGIWQVASGFTLAARKSPLAK